LDASQRHHLLGEAGRVRLRNKSEEVTRRAGSSRWREALFLGLFTALGYKQNVWPMRRIAEAMLRLELREKESQAREELLTAMMLGLGGLIPDGWPDEDPERSEYLKRLWSLWWRLREGVSEHRLPPAIWRMDGVRPVNRPERRLALAACWLSREDLEERLEAWARADLKPAAALTELWGILATDGNRFWETRCTFTSRPMARAAPLLGRSRLTELAMNAVLPWSHARARACGDEVQIRRVEQRYLAWPKAEDNAVLRLARQRLLGMRSAGCLRGAGQQQGLLQIVRDFCARGDALCSGCRFPAYVEGLRRGDR
jgi:hypothetical protein